MNGMNWMEVNSGLKAQQTSITLFIVVEVQALLGYLTCFLTKVAHSIDIVADAVGKKCKLSREIFR